jgi:hypothetical protein
MVGLELLLDLPVAMHGRSGASPGFASGGMQREY